MSSWVSWFTGTRDTKKPAREAIIRLRQNLQLLERKEQHLQTQIDEQLNKARTNAVTNPGVAKAALRRKKTLQTELERLAGQKFTLEAQVNALEGANLNQETLEAMKTGAAALEQIHGKMSVEQVDATMDAIKDQMAVAAEISEAISGPITTTTIDEDELHDEFMELEQDVLNERLEGAGRAPVHTPAMPAKERTGLAARKAAEEEDEEAQLRALQAELSM